MQNLNHKNISAKNAGILYELNQSDTLIIAFGGFKLGLGIPIFEFFKSLQTLDCDRVFIRDLNQLWYQNGVPEYPSFKLLKNHLKELIKDYKKVCFVGNSMGGYAALLFGISLYIDSVLAFSPQSFIDKKNRIRHLDFRWRAAIKNVHSNVEKSKELFDLKSHLETFSSKTQSKIIYSKNDRLDRLHAERIMGINGIKMITKSGDHNLIKELRDSGELHRLLTEIVS